MEIKINNYKYNTPEDINDLDNQQLLGVFDIIYTEKRSGLLRPEELTNHIKMVLICIICKLPKELIAEMSGMDLLKLSPVIDFLFDSHETDEGVKQIYLKQNLTRTPIPKFKAGNIAYYGPADGITNLSIYEFAFADAYMVQYLKTQSEVFLNQMIATLWRPSKPKSQKAFGYGGDRRVDIQKYEHVIEKRSEVIGKKLDEIQKSVILHYFISSRKELFNRYPIPMSDDGGEGYGYAGLILSLAGDKFGDAEKTAQTDLVTILIHLSMMEKEREKAKIQQAMKAM